MNTFVSGESDAKGLSVILPYIAVGPAAVAIRRPELWNAWNVARPSAARRGRAGLGVARLGKESGMARQGPARHGKESGAARLGVAGLGAARLGIWRGVARQGLARQRSAWQGIWQGKARRGAAWPGEAGQGTWAGVTTSKHKTHTEQGTQHNTTLDTCTRKTTQ